VQTDAAAGSDHLIRVRWPVGVRGATPVFETAEAVIGRSPAFVDVDAAEHPWTLDTPANGWFASSVTCRVDVHHSGGVTPAAIAVAEIVVGSQDDVTMVRPLVVALATSGVTSTVTVLDADRSGRLGLDSNAPDIRFVVGEIDHRITGEQLARLSEADACAVRERLQQHGSARAWRPADRPRSDVLRPSMDVRSWSELSTMTIVGASRSALDAEIARMVAELADHAVAVETAQPAPPWAASEAPEDRTVAVLNRGTPGSAVTPDGSLMVSLLRASTGWPSGVWIDPPRRTVPDGSAFQVQHWSHRFEFALLARPGDWRSADIGRAATHYRHPLTVLVEPCHHGPIRPDTVGLRSIDGGVELRAVTTARNSASDGPVVAMRVSERLGTAITTSIRTGFPVRSVRRVDLCGRPTTDGAARVADGVLSIDLPASMAATVELVVDRSGAYTATTTARAHPPAFSRWWVQGRGPRTSTVGPIAVSLHPPGPGPVGTWSATVARVPGCLDADDHAPITVTLELDGHGLALPHDAERHVDLEPNGFVVVPLTGRPDVSSGHHVVRLRAHWRAHSGETGTCYDETVVSDGAATPVIEFSGPAPDVLLRRGSSADATWTLVNHTTSTLFAEVDIVSPWGTWDLVATARSSITLPACTNTELTTTVTSSLGHPHGEWWWMARAVAGPNVAYSPTGSLAVER
jgi:hypothetical protein